MHIGSIGIEGNRDKTQDTPTYLLLGIHALLVLIPWITYCTMQAYPTNTLYTSILDDFGNITQGTMDRECMAVGSLLVVYSVP